MLEAFFPETAGLPEHIVRAMPRNATLARKGRWSSKGLLGYFSGQQVGGFTHTPLNGLAPLSALSALLPHFSLFLPPLSPSL